MSSPRSAGRPSGSRGPCGRTSRSARASRRRRRSRSRSRRVCARSPSSRSNRSSSRRRCSAPSIVPSAFRAGSWIRPRRSSAGPGTRFCSTPARSSTSTFHSRRDWRSSSWSRASRGNSSRRRTGTAPRARGGSPRRVRHVETENERVREVVAILREPGQPRLAELGRSLRRGPREPARRLRGDDPGARPSRRAARTRPAPSPRG